MTEQRSCPDCGTPYTQQLKFNSGNPKPVWMAECTCAEDKVWAALEKRYPSPRSDDDQ